MTVGIINILLISKEDVDVVIKSYSQEHEIFDENWHAVCFIRKTNTIHGENVNREYSVDDISYEKRNYLDENLGSIDVAYNRSMNCMKDLLINSHFFLRSQIISHRNGVETLRKSNLCIT